MLYGPEKPFYRVCDKPLGLSDDAMLWAVDETAGRIWSDDDIAQLRLHASGATAFYQYDETAPESSVASMPAMFGLKCPVQAKAWPDARPVLPSSAELLRENQACRDKVAETVGRDDRLWFGDTAKGKPACNPPTQTNKVQAFVRVCARPKGIGSNVDKWASSDDKGQLLTNSDKVFADAVAKADIVFIFDKTAPPETVYWFVKDPAKLRCPDKPLPMPYDHAKVSGRLEMMAAAATQSAEGASAPKTVDRGLNFGVPDWTSSPTGDGPSLTALEGLVRQLMFAGALASGDTSGNPKAPNGSRYGAVNGKNVGGPNSLLVQAVAGTIAVLGVPLESPKAFIETVRNGLRKGEALLIRDPEFFTKDVAKTLAKEPTEAEVNAAIKAFNEGKDVTLESFGKAMAPALRDAKTIMPYSRAEIFTVGWEGKYQAHHLFEVNMMEALGKGKLAKDAPAIVLTKAEHDIITGKLTAAQKEMLGAVERRGPDNPLNKADVWQMYQRVYANFPNWLNAIEHYFK